MKVEFEDLVSLVGSHAFYLGVWRKVIGAHIYIGESGVKSVRLYLEGIKRYVRFADIDLYNGNGG